ncbi:MAG: cation transporter [Bacteroidales bacterium]|nr:cation transporter [Bacteroidales bacterium]
MSHSPDHHRHNHVPANTSGKSLLWSTFLNLFISVAEIIGGLVSNSLALISDALHNLGDTSALFIAYVANIISRKKYSPKKTFGYKRVEILAALFNALILLVIIVYLFIEAYKRIGNPQPVKGLIMFAVAVVGLLANLISVFLLKKHSGDNLNIKAAYLHLLGDTISSVIVIVSAVLIHFFSIYWIDPLVTILLGIYLMKETFSIIRETLDILMQSTPPGLDLTRVKAELELLPEIDNIHHVHAWNLNDQEIHFECHIDLKTDIRISETGNIKTQINDILVNKFGITHVTIQYEYNCCGDKNLIHNN